jgi:hypothetical protein
MKKFLGNFSPAYGIMTGEGEMGKMAKKGMMGLLPRMIAKGATKEEEEEMKRAQAEGRAMKKGGKVNGFRDGGIYTAEMGQPPQDIDGGSAPRKAPSKPKAPAKPKAPPKPVKPMEVKKAKGGSIDGIAQRGKTNCKMR